jgi:hypothetical protein
MVMILGTCSYRARRAVTDRLCLGLWRMGWRARHDGPRSRHGDSSIRVLTDPRRRRCLAATANTKGWRVLMAVIGAGVARSILRGKWIVPDEL